MPNLLQHESSPYLQQHANNPVNWHPWNAAALQRAEAENKPILLSVGYSACHWCHVMERESFENEAIAAVMNQHFVCIKLDREERPDIDQIYMEAVQAMGLQGGWPLNVFLLPNKQPFYGGTYFRPEQWQHLLQQIAKAYSEQPEQLRESAEAFTKQIGQSEAARFGLEEKPVQFSAEMQQQMEQQLLAKADKTLGGMNRAPKFPMPCLYRYMLYSSSYGGSQAVTQHALFSLQQMCLGGLFDQVGGGFARYSVDAQWFAPHFEKMGYDNGQLLELLCQAWQVSKNPLYLRYAAKTVAFLLRELKTEEGAFYSALDADSEGEEGKFYTWTLSELSFLSEDELELATIIFSLEPTGNWEGEQNILHWPAPAADIAKQLDTDEESFYSRVKSLEQKLLQKRASRIRPGLDNKVLICWNSFIISGLAAFATAARGAKLPGWYNKKELAALATQAEEAALAAANLLWEKLFVDDTLLHQLNSKQHAFLDDYASFGQALLSCYSLSFDELWVQRADEVAQQLLQNFADETEPLLYYTEASAEHLIARKKELFDNVIPASNSLAAHFLQQLGWLTDTERYRSKSAEMLGLVQPLLVKDAQYLAHWALLWLQHKYEPLQLVVVGPKATEAALALQQQAKPHWLVLLAKERTQLALAQHKQPVVGEEVTIFVCRGHSCGLPVHTVEAAIAQIDELEP